MSDIRGALDVERADLLEALAKQRGFLRQTVRGLTKRTGCTNPDRK
jgi:hypothetical protein